MYRKNLILIHLESLNDAIYYGGSHLFPNINSVAKKSIRCNNYYATATSTVMIISDLMFGNIYQYEKSMDLVQMKSNFEKESIFAKLKKDKYHVESIIYSKFPSINDTKDFKEILGENNLYLETDEYIEFVENIERVISTYGKYGLYVYDWTSLNDSVSHRRDECEPGWYNIFENRYRRIDETVGKVFEILKKYGRLEDTTVVLFGDHGDDMWSQGFGKGFTHAVEPYQSLIKVPLFIYDTEIKSVDLNNLLNTSDIAELVEHLLTKRMKKDEILECVFREYSFSRNLFVGQKSKVLNKGYCVTDGRYQLNVSKFGLELYLCRYSCFSQVNLLNFYDLSGKKIKLKRNVTKIPSRHFRFALLYQEEEIRNEFERLFPILKEQIEMLIKKAEVSVDFSTWFNKINYDKNMLKSFRKIVWDERKKYVKSLLHL